MARAGSATGKLQGHTGLVCGGGTEPVPAQRLHPMPVARSRVLVALGIEEHGANSLVGTITGTISELKRNRKDH